jgi:hypothetical protein
MVIDDFILYLLWGKIDNDYEMIYKIIEKINILQFLVI